VNILAVLKFVAISLIRALFLPVLVQTIGKTHFQNDLLSVGWDIRLLTESVACVDCQCHSRAHCT